MADTLRNIGAQMANVMFNLAQRPGDALTGDLVAKMDSLRKQWDAAVRATPPSPSTAPEVDERAIAELALTRAWVLGTAGMELAAHLCQLGVRTIDGVDYVPRAGVMNEVMDWRRAFDRAPEINEAARRAALASRPAEVDDEGLTPVPTAIARESNDALIALAKYWKLNGDWMTCKGCRRSLIASRDGEVLAHGDGCKYWDQQHPWAQLRELIARRPAPAGGAQ